MQYLVSVLGLFDDTLRALLGVPVFAFFLTCFLLAAAFGLFRMMMRSNSRRR